MNALGQIHEQESRLRSLYNRAISETENTELQSDIAKYFCVRISGYLETSVSLMLEHHAKEKSSRTVASFVSNRLSRQTNLNVSRLVALFTVFDKDWGKRIEDYVIDERKAAIDSVVAIRHQISHGKSTGITITRANRYFEHVVEVVQFAYSLCDPVASAQQQHRMP